MKKVFTNKSWKLSKVNFWSNMSNDAYTNAVKFGTLSQDALFFLWSFQKDFEVTKNVKILKFEVNWGKL